MRLGLIYMDMGNGSVYGYDFYGLFTVSIGLGGIVSVSETQSLGVSGWAGANINLTIPTLADILHPGSWNIGIGPYAG